MEETSDAAGMTCSRGRTQTRQKAVTKDSRQRPSTARRKRKRLHQASQWHMCVQPRVRRGPAVGEDDKSEKKAYKMREKRVEKGRTLLAASAAARLEFLRASLCIGGRGKGGSGEKTEWWSSSVVRTDSTLGHPRSAEFQSPPTPTLAGPSSQRTRPRRRAGPWPRCTGVGLPSRRRARRSADFMSIFLQ